MVHTPSTFLAIITGIVLMKDSEKNSVSLNVVNCVPVHVETWQKKSMKANTQRPDSTPIYLDAS